MFSRLFKRRNTTTFTLSQNAKTGQLIDWIKQDPAFVLLEQVSTQEDLLDKLDEISQAREHVLAAIVGLRSRAQQIITLADTLEKWLTEMSTAGHRAPKPRLMLIDGKVVNTAPPPTTHAVNKAAMKV